MKELSDIANRIVADGEIASPDLVKVDVQVRTSGGILPPSWAKAMRELRDDGLQVKAGMLRKEG